MLNNNKSNFLAVSIATALISLSYSANSLADIVGDGGVFLYGENIQVGINKAGAFGSDEFSNITPYDSRAEAIGFISDPSGNQFTGAFDGDFFMPGIQESGWGIRYNNKNYHNTRNYQDGLNNTLIAGSFSDFKALGKTQEVVWTGDIENKLNIRQTFSIYKKGLTAIVDIELKNNTGGVMTDVYYMQTLDPDNNYQTSNKITDFSTLNKIVAQGDTDGMAVVSATQVRDGGTGHSEAKLIGYTKNARVAFGGKTNRDPVDIYTGTSELKTTGEENADKSISLAVKYDKIEPGETVKFKVALQLVNSAIPELTLDKDKSTNASIDNGYKTLYIATTSSIPVVDTDLEITQQAQNNLMGAEIILANPHSDDLIQLPTGSLPAGITIDAQRSLVSKLVLTGEASASDYKTALKAIRYENTGATPNLDERIINILILDKVYTLSNAAQTFIGVVMPVTIQSPIATDDRVNQTEQTSVSPSGTATPNLAVALVFTDKNDKTVSVTTTANDQGVWNSAAVDMSTLADGDITLSAKTTDAKGYHSNATKSFKKDTQIATVVISTPTLDQMIADKEVTISGTADPESAMSVQIDADNHCTAVASTEGNWSCKVDKLVLDKTYPLEVTSTDNAGNESKASSGFKTPPLTFIILTPEDKSTVAGNNPTITGTSLPKTIITVTAGDKNCIATTNAAGEWSCTIEGLPIGGPQSLNIKADGVDGVTNKTKQVEITVPDKPLVVTSPAQNELIKTDAIIITGTTDPHASVTVSSGEAGETCQINADVKGDWSCRITIKKADEAKTLTVTSELTGITKKTATVVTKHPSILDVISPKDKTTVAGTSPLITGKSVPDAVITATVGDKSCTGIASTTGDWHCTIQDLPVGGPQKLVINVVTQGGLKKSIELEISVPEKPLVVTSPQPNEFIKTDAITITGTTDPHALVTVSSGETGETCQVDADVKGDWSCHFDIEKADETKTLTVTSELTGVDKKIATVITTHPSILEVTAPADKTTVESSSPLLSGKSVPNAVITATVSDKSCTATTTDTGDWHCTIKDLPVGGPQKLVIGVVTKNGLKKSTELEISVPEKPLVVTSPQQNDLILTETITTTGKTDPHAVVTVTSDEIGETCQINADANGDWRCDFAIKKADETKVLMVTSELTGIDKKTATVTIKLPSLLEITSPKNNTTVAGTSTLITGKSVPNSLITATVGDKSCSATTTARGEWSCSLKDLPIGSQTLTIEAKSTGGLKKLAELGITVPANPLIVVSPEQNALISGKSIRIKGTTDPFANITVETGVESEACSSTADSNGHWECYFEVAKFSEVKPLTIRSNLNDTSEKVATVNLRLEAEGEKGKTGVTTVLKGGGSSAPFAFLLMALNILLMRRFFKK
ncbi:MAG: hypothetical protein KAH00_03310 [Cocleimonas sp.]|nr:hypothetical protein [Cocleimonas sp.]